jgi:hypothetical protein
MILQLINENLLHLKLILIAIDGIIEAKGYRIVEIVVLFPFVQILYVALVEKPLVGT